MLLGSIVEAQSVNDLKNTRHTQQVHSDFSLNTTHDTPHTRTICNQAAKLLESRGPIVTPTAGQFAFTNYWSNCKLARAPEPVISSDTIFRFCFVPRTHFFSLIAARLAAVGFVVSWAFQGNTTKQGNKITGISRQKGEWVIVVEV